MDAEEFRIKVIQDLAALNQKIELLSNDIAWYKRIATWGSAVISSIIAWIVPVIKQKGIM